MRQIGFLILSLVLLVGCGNNPQSQAEKGVKNFLKKNVQVYEPVSFGVLDTINISEDPEYVAAKDSLRIYMDALKVTADQFKLASNQQNAKRMRETIAGMESFYQGKKYKIYHKYQTHTAEGTSEEVDKDFYLNGLFEVVE